MINLYGKTYNFEIHDLIKILENKFYMQILYMQHMLFFSTNLTFHLYVNLKINIFLLKRYMDPNKKFNNSITITFDSSINYFSLDPGGNHDILNLFIPIFINSLNTYTINFTRYDFELSGVDRWTLWNRYFPGVMVPGVTSADVTWDEFTEKIYRPLVVSDFFIAGGWNSSFNDTNFMLSYESLNSQYTQIAIENAIQTFISSTESKNTQAERYAIWQTITPNLTIPNYTAFQNIPQFTFHVEDYIQEISNWNPNYNDKIMYSNVPINISLSYDINNSPQKRYLNILIAGLPAELLFTNINQLEFTMEVVTPSVADFQLTNTNWNDTGFFKQQPSDTDINAYIAIRSNSDTKTQRYIKWIQVHAAIINYPSSIIFDNEFINEPSTLTTSDIINYEWNSNYNDSSLFITFPTSTQITTYLSQRIDGDTTTQRYIKWYNIGASMIDLYPISNEFTITPAILAVTDFVTLDTSSIVTGWNPNFLDSSIFFNALPTIAQVQSYINQWNSTDTTTQRYIKWYTASSNIMNEALTNTSEFISTIDDIITVTGFNSNFTDQSYFISVPTLSETEQYVQQRSSLNSIVQRYLIWQSLGAQLNTQMSNPNPEFIMSPTTVNTASYILQWEWKSNYKDTNMFINNINGTITIEQITIYLQQYLAASGDRGTQDSRFIIWNTIAPQIMTASDGVTIDEFELTIANYITEGNYNPNWNDGIGLIKPLTELYTMYSSAEISAIFQSYINYSQQFLNRKYNAAVTKANALIPTYPYDVNVTINKGYDTNTVDFQNLVTNAVYTKKQQLLATVKTYLAGLTQGSNISGFTSLINYLNAIYTNYLPLMTGDIHTNYIVFFIEFPYPIDFKSYEINLDLTTGNPLIPALIPDIAPNIQKTGTLMENTRIGTYFFRAILNYFNALSPTTPQPSLYLLDRGGLVDYSIVYNYFNELLESGGTGQSDDDIYQKNTSEIIIPQAYFRRLVEIPYIDPAYMSIVSVSIPHMNVIDMGIVTVTIAGAQPITLTLNYVNAANEAFLSYLQTEINAQLKAQGNVDNTISFAVDPINDQIVVKTTSLSSPTNPPAFSITSTSPEFMEFLGMTTMEGQNSYTSTKSFFWRNDYYDITCNFTRGRCIFGGSANKTYTGTDGNEYIDSAYYGILKHIQINQEIGWMIDNYYGRNNDLVPVTHPNSDYLVFSLRDVFGELVSLDQEKYSIEVEFYW